MQYSGFRSSYLFRSGNAEHPSDRFYNTSVEVLPESSLTSFSKIDYNATSDGFVITGLYILTTSLYVIIHCHSVMMQSNKIGVVKGWQFSI
jgi:hypothetical protein